MKNPRSLMEEFYGGSLSKAASLAIDKRNPSRTNSRGVRGGVNYDSILPEEAPAPFDDDAYDAAIKRGYTINDINGFLKLSGIKPIGSRFRAAGMNDYQGSRGLYWEVSPEPAIQPIGALTSRPTSLTIPDPSNVRT